MPPKAGRRAVQQPSAAVVDPLAGPLGRSEPPARTKSEPPPPLAVSVAASSGGGSESGAQAARRSPEVPSFLDDDAPLPDFEETLTESHSGAAIGHASTSRVASNLSAALEPPAVQLTSVFTPAPVVAKHPVPAPASAVYNPYQPTAAATATSAVSGGVPSGAATPRHTESPVLMPVPADTVSLSPARQLAKLQQELKLLTEESATAERSVEELQRTQTVTQAEQELLNEKQSEYLKLQREVFDGKVKGPETLSKTLQRHDQEFKDLCESLQKSSKETFTAEKEQLEKELHELKEETTVLKAAHETMEKELVASASSTNDADRMHDMIHALFLSARKQMDERLNSTINSEVKDVLSSMMKERGYESQQRMLRRQNTFRQFCKARQDTFQNFRKERNLSRSRSSDEQFALLKQRRDKHVSETRAKTQGLVKEREALLDSELKQARYHAQQNLDRHAARVQAALGEASKAHRSKEKDLEQRGESTLAHQRRLHKDEKASAEARYRTEAAALEESVATQLAQVGPSSLDAPTFVGALRSEIQRIAGDVAHSCVCLKEEADPFSRRSVATSAVLEKTAAIVKLRALVLRQRDTTSQSWNKLDSLVSKLDVQLGQLSSAMSDGRSSVAVAQQRVDSVRSTWERQHRQQLSSAKLDDVLSRDDILLKVLGDIAFKSQQLISKENVLCSQRSNLLRTVETGQEAILDRQCELTGLNAKMMTRYDDLARLSAAAEAKEQHLASEVKELDAARCAVEDDIARFEEEGEQMRMLSAKLQNDAEMTAQQHQENTHKLMYTQQWHAHHFKPGSRGHISNPQPSPLPHPHPAGGAGGYSSHRRTRKDYMPSQTATSFFADFSSLVRLSSDEEGLVLRGSSDEPASSGSTQTGTTSTTTTGTNTGTLTTPSPSGTEGTGDESKPLPRSSGEVL